MTSYFTNPAIQKSPLRCWEESPFVIAGSLYRAGFKRSWTATLGTSLVIDRYDAAKERFFRVAEIPWTRYLGCMLVTGDGRLFVFGTTDVGTTQNRVVMRQIDPATWTFVGSEVTAYQAPIGHKVFNSSATYGPDGYILALETDEGSQGFSMRFMQSVDLTSWVPIGALCFPDVYVACPTIKYAENGYYLISYLWKNQKTSGIWFESAMARSNDLVTISTFQGNAQFTPYQSLMSPDEHEGVNNSDIDFIEWNGKVYFTYLMGDQTTWGMSNDAWFNGSLIDFYRQYWP